MRGDHDAALPRGRAHAQLARCLRRDPRAASRPPCEAGAALPRCARGRHLLPARRHRGDEAARAAGEARRGAARRRWLEECTVAANPRRRAASARGLPLRGRERCAGCGAPVRRAGRRRRRYRRVDPDEPRPAGGRRGGARAGRRVPVRRGLCALPNFRYHSLRLVVVQTHEARVCVGAVEPRRLVPLREHTRTHSHACVVSGSYNDWIARIPSGGFEIGTGRGGRRNGRLPKRKLGVTTLVKKALLN
mmetsp:Transcript_45265/g.96257  ORF Transcript_45265/g.96257 Transcript_45265/m.96257 type:complete len:248 (+) Transcript_45265:1111-1854(+)